MSELTVKSWSGTLAQVAGGLSCVNFKIPNITLANLVGAVFVAYFLGHVTGLTEGAIFAKILTTAESKVNATFWQGVFSDVGCNWLVGMGVWLSFCAKDVGGKIIGIWFPIMTFVAVDFQHVVANMFVIPAEMFSGANITLMQFFNNMCIMAYIQ